ncbi:MAG: sigma-54 dependent transcriptional regulator [Fibrobacterota bacterium]
MKSVLIASDNSAACETIRSSLDTEYAAETAADRADCYERFKHSRYDFLFIDLRFLPEGTQQSIHHFKQALQAFLSLSPAVQIVVMGPHERVKDAVNAVKAGAVNYLTYPIDPDEVKYIIQTTYEFSLMQSELDYLRDQFIEEDPLETFQSNSPVMKKVYEKIQSVAPAKTTVLLTGETGTGKGVLARLIHRLSRRPENKFISEHCGAIPDSLIESELYGHEKGAFTGAIRKRIGKFEIAGGGTIFLDEIGTITLAAQIKLLQILQDRTFQRVGGEETILCDARIIAATNTDLKQMSENNAFRRDLYYRLSVFPIEIPPLRERLEDLPLFVDVFLNRLNKFYLKAIQGVDAVVLRAFENYPWPGNIRELENLIERAYLLETAHTLTRDSFPKELFSSDPSLTTPLPDLSLTLAEVRRKGVENIEILYLRELLSRHKGSIKRSAGGAGITTRQLHKLLTRYRIRKEEFKK